MIKHNHAAYVGLKGHLAFLETTDREAALHAAIVLDNELDTVGSVPTDRAHFEEHIDRSDQRILSETRPDVGDFAVSVTIALPYEIKALADDPLVYLVIAQTRNGARDFSDVNGPERLQRAFNEALGDILIS